MFSSTILVTAAVPLTWGWAIGEEQRTAAPELTMAVARQAIEGWDLYQSGEFVSSFKGGRYTDTNPDSQGYDFWSDGRYARLDRHGDGHHETVFRVEDDQLVYVGSLNKEGRFGHTARNYRQLRNQPLTSFEELLP